MLNQLAEVHSIDTTSLSNRINAKVDISDIDVNYTYYNTDEVDSLLTLITDTLTYTWSLLDTVIVQAFPSWKVPYNITLLEIAAYTDANTTTFNIEERAATTPNSAGTDAISSDLVADNNQQLTSTFSNASFAKGTWVTPTISATDDVAIFSITIKYIKE